MKPTHRFALALFALLLAPCGFAANPLHAIAAAIASSARPAGDKAQDAERKPAQVLAFAGIKPGDTVVDLMPGAGYYTRLFSTLVGPTGKVIALEPAEMARAAPKPLAALRALAGTPPYANVMVQVQPLASLKLAHPADLVWTSQNYHDLHDAFMGPADMPRFNRAILAMLKPGGRFLVLDHAAAPGTGVAHTDDLHRIDPAAVKQEVTGAGFRYVGASEALRNPADDHTAAAFDPTIKGRTDKFLLAFRKP